MGYTFCKATHYKRNGEIDRKREINDILTWSESKVSSHVVKSTMKGAIYYGAIKYTENEKEIIQGVVAITKINNNSYFNFGYTTITENANPLYYDCPTSILKLLSSTDNEHALKWRRMCKENAEKPKLKNVEVGQKIKWIRHNGKEIELVKMEPGYQFKRPWWYDADTNGYVPQKRIVNWKLI